MHHSASSSQTARVLAGLLRTCPTSPASLRDPSQKSRIQRHGEHWDREHHAIQKAYISGSSSGVFRAGPHMSRMDLPLSCYFISSGHNSYLTGNQLTAPGGTKTIIRSLEQGCRVIELDVYNQQLGITGPVCKHGGTVTKPVAFQTCVEAIAETAFKASPYPVIITIENHTDEENQRAMASILQKTLGGMLYIPSEGDVGKPWKSPEELKNKVLIRTNVGKCCAELKALVYIANSKFKGVRATVQEGTITSSSFDEQKARKLVKEAFVASGVPWRSSDPGSASRPAWANVLKTVSSKSKTPKGKPGSGKETAEQWLVPPESPVPEHKPDLADVAAAAIETPADAATDEAVQTEFTLTELYQYSATCLMRVYPGGLRVDSSNYEPHHAWAAGASLAALNWQKNDQAVWINRALFDQNGGAGYVLKPDWMLSSILGEPAKGLSPLPQRKPKTLAVTIYSAYCRQGKNFSVFKDDLYVQMDVLGMPMDTNSQHTKTVNNTGRLVVDKTYYFQVAYPEMAVLLISLMDEDMPGKNKVLDDVLGHWEVALPCLEPGEYKVLLTDLDGREREDRWVRVGLAWRDDDVPCPKEPTPAQPAPPVAQVLHAPTASSPDRPSPAEGASNSAGGSPEAADASLVTPLVSSLRRSGNLEARNS